MEISCFILKKDKIFEQTKKLINFTINLVKMRECSKIVHLQSLFLLFILIFSLLAVSTILNSFASATKVLCFNDDFRLPKLWLHTKESETKLSTSLKELKFTFLWGFFSHMFSLWRRKSFLYINKKEKNWKISPIKVKGLRKFSTLPVISRSML